MRQTLMIAAIHMAFSVGIRQKAWDIAAKVGVNDAALKAEFMQYVEPATEMFELAEEMAMTKPNDAEATYYNGVGHWFSLHCRENKKFPTREEALAGLAEGINMIFSDALSSTQKELLAKKLAEFE